MKTLVTFNFLRIHNKFAAYLKKVRGSYVEILELFMVLHRNTTHLHLWTQISHF